MYVAFSQPAGGQSGGRYGLHHSHGPEHHSIPESQSVPPVGHYGQQHQHQLNPDLRRYRLNATHNKHASRALSGW